MGHSRGRKPDARLPVAIKVLGDVEVTCGDDVVSSLPRAAAQTLALIAVSEPTGITSQQLADLLPSGRAQGDRLSLDALHHRVKNLKTEYSISLTFDKSAGYRLDPSEVSTIDAVEFIDGVDALSSAPTVAQVDALMALWRGNPWSGWAEPARWPWNRVLAARDELIRFLLTLPEDERRRSTQVARFAALFPEEANVRRLAPRPPKPRLLVVDDQLTSDLRELLESDFRVVEVPSLKEWNAVCESLDDVDGALIDLHMKGEDDSLGTTKIAEYLRRHTEIPVVLMSVAPPALASKQREMQDKYRLLDVVLKTSNGRFNDKDILAAAHSLVDTRESARRLRLEQWVRSDLYHMEDNRAFSGDRRKGASHPADKCRRQADSLMTRLRSMPIEDAERAVNDFHQAWGPRSVAARS